MFRWRLNDESRFCLVIVNCPMSTHIHIYIRTLYLDTVKTSVARLRLKTKTDLHVCRVGVRGGQLPIYLYLS